MKNFDHCKPKFVFFSPSGALLNGEVRIFEQSFVYRRDACDAWSILLAQIPLVTG